jgi:dolichyl-phosphate beta-glucosyltransferase
MAVAAPLELPEFLRPLWTWIEATPVYVLVVLFVSLITLALFEVCPLLNPSMAPRIVKLTSVS